MGPMHGWCSQHTNWIGCDCILISNQYCLSCKHAQALNEGLDKIHVSTKLTPVKQTILDTAKTDFNDLYSNYKRNFFAMVQIFANANIYSLETLRKELTIALQCERLLKLGNKYKMYPVDFATRVEKSNLAVVSFTKDASLTSIFQEQKAARRVSFCFSDALRNPIPMLTLLMIDHFYMKNEQSATLTSSFFDTMTERLITEIPFILQYFDDIACKEFAKARELQLKIVNICADKELSDKEKHDSICCAMIE